MMAQQDTLKLERTATPGIYKRGERYVVVFRDPQGKQRKAFARTLAEARDVKASMRADIARGEYRTTSKEQLEPYARRVITSYGGRTRRGIRDETRADYLKRLEQDTFPYLGSVSLGQIEARHLDELAGRIAKRGVAANTVRLQLAPLKIVLAEAHARGDIRLNPAAGHRTRYEQASEDVDGEEDVKALSEEELARLLVELPSDWRPFFEFLAQTGLRIGEAIELRWKDVDTTRRRFEVRRRFYRGKVGRPKSRFGRRTLRLTPATANALARRRGDGEALVFTAGRGGRIQPSNLMSRVLKPPAVRAGLGEWIAVSEKERRAESWVGFHTFRHTCATMLFRKGWNAVQVQRWLGHHKPSFTIDTYVHLLEDDIPDPSFLDATTTAARWATGGQPDPQRTPETRAPVTAVISRNGADSPDSARQPEVLVAYS
jgi:integrase